MSFISSFLRFVVKPYRLTLFREAKKRDTAHSALPQLLLYLAGVQENRKKTLKVNSSVFGISTDSSIWLFAYLDEERNLYTSKLYEWRTQKDLIVRWIDGILHDAIRASPATTPVKQNNTSLRNYKNCMTARNYFGSVREEFEFIEGKGEKRCKVIHRVDRYITAPMSDDDSNENPDLTGDRIS